MSSTYRVSQRIIQPAAGIVLLLSGCVSSMTSSKEELRDVGESEGIVIGSVSLTAAQGDANESGLAAFARGRKASELEYTVSIHKQNPVPVVDWYTVPATPGREDFFVKKLPAGMYYICCLNPSGLLAPSNLNFPLGLRFYVKPRQVTYIGKLVVNFPDRINQGSHFEFTIEDAQQETIDKLKNEHSSIAPNAVKELAGRNIVPGNTAALPLLQRDTLTMIDAIDGANDKSCTKRSVVNTEIIIAPTPDSPAGVERWTLDRCGTKIQYRVTFNSSARGGTDIGVSQEK